MDIKTAVNCIMALPPHISVLIRGDHGIGKSELVKQVAMRLDLPLLDRRMSQTTEGDILGLPKVENGVTQFMPPEYVKRAIAQPVILFLDEVNRATQEVMQACFQFALDRCTFSGEKFHKETRVFAAVNNNASYQVNEMDPAFLDRFFIIDLEPTAEDFYEHAETRPAELGGPIDPDLLRFLKERRTILDPARVNPGTKQPSRRSWVRLDGIFRANSLYGKDLKQDVAAKGFAYSLAVGMVGVEAANSLVDYLANRETNFTADHVLNQYSEENKKKERVISKVGKKIRELGQDKLNTLIDLVLENGKTNLWTAEQAKNLGMFVADLPGELRVGFITSFTRQVRPHDTFQPNFRTMNPEVMPHIIDVFNNKEEADKVTAAINAKREKEEKEKAEKEKAEAGKKAKK